MGFISNEAIATRSPWPHSDSATCPVTRDLPLPFAPPHSVTSPGRNCSSSAVLRQGIRACLARMGLRMRSISSWTHADAGRTFCCASVSCS
ncbi:conserved hypothetical protein [Ricinus communis]|uniref:Uncharacterized protein n=1 Tax=Ricinus communis TaxID=3988 RepID=B9TMV3_RICCO|nr:conserved hypothetical protein [Ricinus communis]